MSGGGLGGTVSDEGGDPNAARIPDERVPSWGK